MKGVYHIVPWFHISDDLFFDFHNILEHALYIIKSILENKSKHWLLYASLLQTDDLENTNEAKRPTAKINMKTNGVKP